MRGGDSGGVGVGLGVWGSGGSTARVPVCARGVGTAALGNAVGLRCPELRAKGGSGHRSPERYEPGVTASPCGRGCSGLTSAPRRASGRSDKAEPCVRRLRRGSETLRAAAVARRGDAGRCCRSCPAVP